MINNTAVVIVHLSATRIMAIVFIQPLAYPNALTYGAYIDILILCRTFSIGKSRGRLVLLRTHY